MLGRASSPSIADQVSPLKGCRGATLYMTDTCDSRFAIKSHNRETSSFICHRMVDCERGAANTCPCGVPYLPAIVKMQ